MARDGSLSRIQRRAIASLISYRDVAAAAMHCGVGERTLHRWLHSDARFQAALTAAEGDAIDGATRRLVGLSDSAIDVIAEVMATRSNTAGVRLRSAAVVLDYLLRLRELNSLERRVAALEESVCGGER